MFGLTVLDLALILTLLSYLIYGLRNGFLVTLGGLAGFAVGAVAAFLSVPLVSNFVEDSNWRLTAIIGTAVVLVVLGNALGTMIGRKIRSAVRIKPLRAVDRMVGGAVNLVGGSAGHVHAGFQHQLPGRPVRVPAAGRIQGHPLHRRTDAQAGEDHHGAAAVSGDRGRHPHADRGHRAGPAGAVPNANTDTPALNRAAGSVLKIAGTAFQCGQNQTGTGFVVSPGRVVTNAHVVAGVSQPVVEVPGGGAMPGRVVYFDSQHDLAVLAVDGLPPRRCR